MLIVYLFPGNFKTDEDAVSVPRRLWVVRAEDLLAVDPHLLRGRRLPEGQVQRRQAGEARGLVVVLDYLVM